MNLHLTKVITLVGAFVAAFAVGGVATRLLNFDISWRGASQQQEVSSDTSKAKQSTARPTIILKQDDYGWGSVKSSASEKIYVQPTIVPYVSPGIILPSAQTPAKQTQTVYIGYLSLTTQCLVEGVDAVKTADSTMLDSFYDAKSCIEDRKSDVDNCVAGCDTVLVKATNLCVTNYQLLGYSTFNDCGNGEESKWINCRQQCVDVGKQKMENCVTRSRQQENSLKSLVATYCNK